MTLSASGAYGDRQLRGTVPVRRVVRAFSGRSSAGAGLLGLVVGELACKPARTPWAKTRVTHVKYVECAAKIERPGILAPGLCYF